MKWYSKFGIGAALGILLTVFVMRFPNTSEQWASWVQAFGSIGAIYFAIYTLRVQHDRDRARVEEEDRLQLLRLLQSLKDELEVVKASFALSAGNDIKNSIPGNGVNASFYLSDKPFQVYASHVDRIGLIPKDDLRRKIIATYTRFNIFILALKMQNDLFHVVEQWNRKIGYANSTPNIEQNDRQTWNEHGNVLRTGYEDCITMGDKLIYDLGEAILKLKNN